MPRSCSRHPARVTVAEFCVQTVGSPESPTAQSRKVPTPQWGGVSSGGVGLIRASFIYHRGRDTSTLNPPLAAACDV